MAKLISLASRVLFVGAFVLAFLAVWEKLARLTGYTVLRTATTPSRLIELAAVILLFVIALQLREMKTSM